MNLFQSALELGSPPGVPGNIASLDLSELPLKSIYQIIFGIQISLQFSNSGIQIHYKI